MISLAFALTFALLASAEMATDVPGEQTSMSSKIMEIGQSVLQSFKPLKNVCQHVCGLHVYDGEPNRQLIAHHYCSHLNEEVRQCVIYDKSEANAKLIGIEYIISQSLYDGLPDNEKRFWHPHAYEVKSGLLVAPGLPEMAERMDMEKLVSTWGKTWNLWQVDRNDPLPYGEPKLMMAFTEDGQADQRLIAEKDRQTGISTEERRKSRQDVLLEHERGEAPAGGVWDSIKQHASDAAEYGKQKGEELLETAKGAAGTARDYAASIGQQAQETAVKAKDAAAEGAQRAGEELKEGGKKGVEDVKQMGHDITEHGRKAAHEAGEAGRKAGQEIKEGGKQVADEARQGRDELAEHGKEAAHEVNQAGRKAKDEGRKAGEDIKEGASEAANQAGQKAQDAGQEIKHGVKKAGEDIKQGAQQAGRKAQDAGEDIKQGAHQAGRKAQDAGEDIKQGAHQAGRKAQDAGEDIKQGAHQAGRKAQDAGEDIKQGAHQAGRKAQDAGEEVKHGVHKASEDVKQGVDSKRQCQRCEKTECHKGDKCDGKKDECSKQAGQHKTGQNPTPGHYGLAH